MKEGASLKIRNYQAIDLDEIMTLFYNTVHNINKKDDTESQLNAWAPKVLERTLWKQSFEENICFVVEDKGKIVGFGDLNNHNF